MNIVRTILRDQHDGHRTQGGAEPLRAPDGSTGEEPRQQHGGAAIEASARPSAARVIAGQRDAVLPEAA
jgi:hypothetical protein